MATLLSKSIYGTVARVVLLGLMAFCGASSPAVGQETVAGKVQPAGRKPFGKKMRSPGAATLFAAPAGLGQTAGGNPGAWPAAGMRGGPGRKDRPIGAPP